MKKMLLILVVSIIVVSLTFAEEANQESLNRLSQLFKKASAPNVKLPDEEKAELKQLLHIVLPDNNYIGDDKEWVVSYHDMESGDFFQVDLKKKGDESSDSDIWFHILYLPEKPSFYGFDNFEGYPAMGMEDVHCFILIGNVEIRAVASSAEYKNDNKIKGMLKAFKLKEIEKL